MMRQFNPDNRGFAVIMSILLMALAIMLITSYASIMQSASGQIFSEASELLASSAATSGVHYAIAEILGDTNNSPVSYANKKVILTEVLLNGKGSEASGGSGHVVISEVGADYGAGTGDYIELYNPTSAAVSLSGMYIQRGTATANSVTNTIPLSGSIPGRGFFLIANGTVGVTPDIDTTSCTFNDDDWIALVSNATDVTGSSDADIIDLVGWATGWIYEGSPAIDNLVVNNNFDAFERKAAVATSGSANTDGNGYDNGSNSGDWVEADAQNPQNSGSATEIPISQPGGSSGADRKYEFIEIQNTDSNPIDLVTNQCWISVRAVPAPPTLVGPTTKRYLFPIDGGDNKLDTYEVGLIIANDVGTGTSTWGISGAPRYFGLGPSGGPSATDTQLGIDGDTNLNDTGAVVMFGCDLNTIYEYGVEFPDSITSYAGTTTSWRKLSATVLDDNDGNYDSISTNWDTLGYSPGNAFTTSGGRSDGPDDDWYQLAADSFTEIMKDVYFRVRVFDESGKVNINTVKFRNGNVSETGSSAFQQVLEANPQPYWSTTVLTSTQKTSFYANAQTFAPWSASEAQVFSPSSAMFVMDGSDKSKKYFPFITPYEFDTADAGRININTAESPALLAGISVALQSASSYPDTKAIAEEIYSYLTAGDADPANDLYFTSIGDLAAATSPGFDDEISGGMTRLKDMFSTTSTGYFTIWATGFVFSPGDDPLTDTPAARSDIMAVYRRETTDRNVTGAGNERGSIVFWKEIFEDDITRFPITTAGPRRYPKYKWDPDY